MDDECGLLATSYKQVYYGTARMCITRILEYSLGNNNIDRCLLLLL